VVGVVDAPDGYIPADHAGLVLMARAVPLIIVALANHQWAVTGPRLVDQCRQKLSRATGLAAALARQL
jgi:hypothetical protein